MGCDQSVPRIAKSNVIDTGESDVFKIESGDCVKQIADQQIAERNYKEQSNMLKFKIAVLVHMLSSEEKKQEKLRKRIKALKWAFLQEGLTENRMSHHDISNESIEAIDIDRPMKIMSDLMREEPMRILSEFADDDGNIPPLDRKCFSKKLFHLNNDLDIENCRLKELDCQILALRFYDNDLVSVPEFLAFFMSDAEERAAKASAAAVRISLTFKRLDHSFDDNTTAAMAKSTYAANGVLRSVEALGTEGGNDRVSPLDIACDKLLSVWKAVEDPLYKMCIDKQYEDVQHFRIILNSNATVKATLTDSQVELIIDKFEVDDVVDCQAFLLFFSRLARKGGSSSAANTATYRMTSKQMTWLKNESSSARSQSLNGSMTAFGNDTSPEGVWIGKPPSDVSSEQTPSQVGKSSANQKSATAASPPAVLTLLIPSESSNEKLLDGPKPTEEPTVTKTSDDPAAAVPPVATVTDITDSRNIPNVIRVYDQDPEQFAKGLAESAHRCKEFSERKMLRMSSLAGYFIDLCPGCSDLEAAAAVRLVSLAAQSAEDVLGRGVIVPSESVSIAVVIATLEACKNEAVASAPVEKKNMTESELKKVESASTAEEKAELQELTVLQNKIFIKFNHDPKTFREAVQGLAKKLPNKALTDDQLFNWVQAYIPEAKDWDVVHYKKVMRPGFKDGSITPAEVVERMKKAVAEERKLKPKNPKVSKNEDCFGCCGGSANAVHDPKAAAKQSSAAELPLDGTADATEKRADTKSSEVKLGEDGASSANMETAESKAESKMDFSRMDAKAEGARGTLSNDLKPDKSDEKSESASWSAPSAARGFVGPEQPLVRRDSQKSAASDDQVGDTIDDKIKRWKVRLDHDIDDDSAAMTKKSKQLVRRLPPAGGGGAFVPKSSSLNANNNEIKSQNDVEDFD